MSGLWAELPVQVKSAFESSHKILKFKRGEMIYRAGDHPQGIYFIKKGLVGLTIIGAASGKEHLLRFFKDGQFFGHRSLFSNEEYHGNTVALEPTEIYLIPTATLFAILEQHPHLYKEIIKVVSKELRRCEMQHIMILENQILPRVAQALVYLKEIHPDHSWTRQEIASFCASTTSTMIKALAELEQMGFIKQEGRKIEILKRDSLIALQDQLNS